MNEENNPTTELIYEPDAEHLEVMPMQPNALEAIERASLDMQIITAKKFPRSLKQFIHRATDLVSIDQDTALSCIYRRPVGKKNGRMLYAEGESIRLAEIVAACYGNLRVSGLIDESGSTERYVKAIGMAIDLETNYAAKAEVVEATVSKKIRLDDGRILPGRPYDERMRIVTAKAAQSKAIRDAIFRVVPKSVCKPITQKAREVAIGENETLEQRRSRAEEYITRIAVDSERIYTALGISGIEEMGNDELLTLTGLRTAIKDGDITIDEAFPPIKRENNHRQGVSGVKERLSKSSIPETQKQDEPDAETQARIAQQKADLQADIEQAEQTAKDKFGTPAEVAAARQWQDEEDALFICANGHRFVAAVKDPKQKRGRPRMVCPACFNDDYDPVRELQETVEPG